MSILLQNVRVVDPVSSYNSRIVDILIVKGFIQKIGKSIKEGSNKINLEGQFISPGWFDLNAQFNDPGFEHREDIFSGLNAAAAGGFTDVCVFPNTNPVIQTKGDVEYILSKSRHHAVNLHPIGALSKHTEGKELAELHDLHAAGAVAFSDGSKTTDNSELLLKGLQYVQKFDGLLINHPADLFLIKLGQMHEGKRSTTLGLKGIPSIAESTALERDLGILKYSGGRLHISQISCSESVKLIKKAKNEGLKVTCDVSYLHLLFTDETIPDFDTNYKIFPPFRGERDRLALIKGLISGTIDAIVSAHQPQDEENKNLEFDLASFGIGGIQTVFPALLSLKDDLPLETAIAKLSNGPADVLGKSIPAIAEGNVARLTIMNPEESWKFDSSTNYSKSKNNPFYDQKLTGKITGIINGAESIFF